MCSCSLLHTYRLVGLCPTLVTSVSGHYHSGFDFRHTSDNSTHSHQFPQRVSPYFPDHTRLVTAWAFKVQLTKGKKQPLARSWKTNSHALPDWDHLQSTHEFRRVLVLGASRSRRVPAPLLHHQPVLNINIQNILIYHLQVDRRQEKWVAGWGIKNTRQKLLPPSSVQKALEASWQKSKFLALHFPALTSLSLYWGSSSCMVSAKSLA